MSVEGARFYLILLLTHKADRRTLAYATVTTALLILQWNLAAIQPVIYLWFLFMAVSVAVIAHNHNHVPIWRSRSLNIVTDYWLTLFYGFPAFGWIPTHNKNHHFLNNKAGDYTITYRVSEKNNVFTLLSYPSISSYFQQKKGSLASPVTGAALETLANEAATAIENTRLYREALDKARMEQE